MSIKFRGDITKTVAKNVGSFTNTPLIKRGKSSITLVGGGPLPIVSGNKILTARNGKLNYSVIGNGGTVSTTSLNYSYGEPLCDQTPMGVATYDSGTKALVISQYGSSVKIVDLVNNSVLSTLACFFNPKGIIVSSNGTRAVCYSESQFAGNYYLFSIDLTTYRSSMIKLGNYQPNCVAITNDGTKAVVGSNGVTIQVVNLLTGTLTNLSAPAGTNIYGIAVTPDGSKAITANLNNYSATIVNLTTTPTIATTVSCASGYMAWDVAVNSDGTRAVVASSGKATVINMVTNSKVGTDITTISGGYCKVVISSNGKAIISRGSSDRVSIFDINNTGTVTNVTCGITPDNIVVTPDSSKAIVANASSSNLTFIDLSNYQPTNVNCQVIIAGKIALSHGATKVVACLYGLNKLAFFNLNSPYSMTTSKPYMSTDVYRTSSTGSFAIQKGKYIDLLTDTEPVLLAAPGVENYDVFDISPNGNLIAIKGGTLATPYSGNVCHIIDTLTKTTLASLTMGGTIDFIKITPDGTKALVTYEKWVVIINLTNYTAGTPIAWGVNSNTATDLQISPNSQKAVICGAYQGTGLFTILGLTNSLNVSVSLTGANTCTISPDSTKVIVSSNNSTITSQIYSLNNSTAGNLISSFGSTNVSDVKYSPDGTKVVTIAGSPRKINVWNASSLSGSPLKSFRVNRDIEKSRINFTPDSKNVVVSHFDTHTGEESGYSPAVVDLIGLKSNISEISIPDNNIGQDVFMSPNGMKAVATSESAIYIIDTINQTILSTFSEGSNTLFGGIDISPDSTKAVVLIRSKNGVNQTANNVKIFDLTNPTATPITASVNDQVTFPKFSPDNTRISMKSTNSGVAIYTVNLSNGNSITTRSGFVTTYGRVKFINNTKMITLGYSNGSSQLYSLYTYDVATGVVQTINLEGITPQSLDLTPDNTRAIVSGVVGGINKIWSVDLTNNQVTVLTTFPDSTARKIKISPDGTKAFLTDGAITSVINLMTNTVVQSARLLNGDAHAMNFYNNQIIGITGSNIFTATDIDSLKTTLYFGNLSRTNQFTSMLEVGEKKYVGSNGLMIVAIEDSSTRKWVIIDLSKQILHESSGKFYELPVFA